MRHRWKRLSTDPAPLVRLLGRAPRGLRERERALHDDLAEHATDYERVGALSVELREVEDERIRLEDEWLALADQ